MKNGGAGVYIKFPDGQEVKLSHPTGLHSTNYKAEVEAITTGVQHVLENPDTSSHKVFLSDAKSALQAMESGNDKNLNNLMLALSSLCENHTTVLQWIPAHCGIPGNEIADMLAKKGSSYTQENTSTNLKEATTIIKAHQRAQWLEQHPKFKPDDPLHKLTRAEQVIIFRLRTGHNRLNYHMHRKFNIGQSDQCPCQTGSMTVEHVLQSCPKHQNLRQQAWEHEVPMTTKLYGCLRDLLVTSTFIQHAGVVI